MAKFKVGDKVRVIDFKKNPPHWSRSGGMDKWKGKTVTLEKITRTNVTSDMEFSLVEDRGEILGLKWVWKSSDFEPVKPRREFIVIRRDGAKTIAELRHDREVIKSGTAICNASDTFDFPTGAKLAFDRLMGREEPKPEPQPAHRFKVGDRVVYEARGGGVVKKINVTIMPQVPYWVEFEDGSMWLGDDSLSPATAPEPPKYIPKVGDRVVTEFGNGTIFSIDKFGSVAVWHDSWNLGHNIPSAVKGLSGNKGRWFTPSTLNPVAGASDV